MKRVSRVQQIIDTLTTNEDHRQELWLHHIDGSSLLSFEQKLKKIKEESSRQERFMHALSSIYINPPSDETIKTLSVFSNFEQSIMFLLLLGFSVKEVSEYKGISCIRIQQTIESIKEHTIWKEYGT